jgi:hypothetical protein
MTLVKVDKYYRQEAGKIWKIIASLYRHSRFGNFQSLMLQKFSNKNRNCRLIKLGYIHMAIYMYCYV